MENDTLQRYIEGNSTCQEKEDVAKWLDADEKNMQEFLLLRSIYDAYLWNNGEVSAGEKESLSKDKRRKAIRSKIVFEFLKVAAIFLLAVGCYHLFFAAKPQPANNNIALQTVYAPEGERAEIALSDGTKVWLNAKSSLKFPSQFSGNERLVELDGEAYFDVAHDDEKKFIVRAGEYQVKVYGTEFNVNAYRNSSTFETALVKGSVEVVSNTTNESVMLKPNSKVSKKDSDSGLVLSNMETQDQFLWKKGILYIENQNVEELFKKLELYYGANIEVRNKELLAHQYTGKFWINDGIEHVLRVLQLYHNFKYTKDNMNHIIIY